MRALSAHDAGAARALVQSAYGRTRHLARTLELVELALTGNDPESVGLACVVADDSLAGLLLYGTIGGAVGVIKVHALLGETVEELASLIDALRSVCDARMFVCELSDERTHALASRALASHGFMCEGRIADYFSEGVALDLLVLRGARGQE